MSSIYDRLKHLDITLPPLAAPAAAYVPFVRTGNLVFLSGHIAKRDGKPWVGQLGRDMTTDDGKQAARAVAIDLLGTLHAAVGDLDKVERIVRLHQPGQQHRRLHRAPPGDQRLLRAARRGVRRPRARMPARLSAWRRLPLGACVEIELIAEVRMSGARPLRSIRSPSADARRAGRSTLAARTFALTARPVARRRWAALVPQHVFGMEPCPWCVLQRVIFVLSASPRCSACCGAHGSDARGRDLGVLLAAPASPLRCGSTRSLRDRPRAT